MNEVVTDIGRAVLKETADPDFFIEELSNMPTFGRRVRYLMEQGYSGAEAQMMLFNEIRDLIVPAVQTVVEREIVPWLDTECDEYLPELPLQLVAASAVELLEVDGVSIRRSFIEKLIDAGEVVVSVNSTQFRLATEERDVNPKRVIDKITYQSRKPDGGPVVRSRTQWFKFDRTKERLERESRVVVFEPILEEEALVVESYLSDEVLSDYQVPLEKWEVFRYVVDSLRNRGDKQWLTGREDLLLERLAQIARGEEVDFLIWNCLGFEFVPDEEGGFPKTIVTSNLDTAITRFFADQLGEVMQIVSSLGNANFVILVPTNEGLGDGLGIWRYVQSKNERQSIIDQAITEFGEIIEMIELYSGSIGISVMRWDDYLELSECGLDQNEITGIGIESSYFSDAESLDYREEVLAQGKSTLRDYSSELDLDDPMVEQAILARQLRFKGVYRGEGAVSRGNRIGNRDMVWLNFEGAGVKEDQLAGAQGNIAIVTPISQSAIQGYYRSKREILNRKP